MRDLDAFDQHAFLQTLITLSTAFVLHVTCATADIAKARDLLDETLEKHNYPIRDVETLLETEERVELAASLTSTTADYAELDAVVAELQTKPGIESSTWSVSALS